MTTRKPSFTTTCEVCKRRGIGVLREYNLRKRNSPANNAWRVAQHKFRGAICIGSRVTVDPDNVIAQETGRVAANG